MTGDEIPLDPVEDSGHRWKIQNGEHYWADADGNELAAIEIWPVPDASDAVRLEAEAELRRVLTAAREGRIQSPSVGSRPICWRDTDETLALIDKAAADDEVSRSDWLAGIVDRGLLGKGLLSVDQVRDRRRARVEAADDRRAMGRGIRRYRPHPEED